MIALFKNGIIERSRPGITTRSRGVEPNHELPNIGSTGVRTIQVGSPSKVGTYPASSLGGAIQSMTITSTKTANRQPACRW
jgi:hypothetical protein